MFLIRGTRMKCFTFYNLYPVCRPCVSTFAGLIPAWRTLADESTPYEMNRVNQYCGQKNCPRAFGWVHRILMFCNDIDLSIYSSSSLSIRGECSCGKTTLLNLIARIETADRKGVCWGRGAKNEVWSASNQQSGGENVLS